ncbi:MAG: glycosyltransferase [Elainellaceae cyanobacterium]
MDYLNLGCGHCFHPDWVNVDFTSTGEGVIAHDLRQGIPFDDASFDVVYHSHVLEHLTRPDAENFLKECHRVLRPNGILRVVVPDLEQIARLYLKALEEAIAGSKEWANNYEWLMLEMYDQMVRHHSGGAMADYLAQAEIPNQAFVIERIGFEGENLIQILKHRPKSATPSTTEEDSRETALKIGEFRLSGEVHQWMYDRYSLSALLNKTGFVDVRVCQARESRIPDFENYHLDLLPDGRVRKPDSLFVEAIESRPNLWRQHFTGAATETLKIVQLNTIDVGGGAARAAQRLHHGCNRLGHRSLLLTAQQRFRETKTGQVTPISSSDAGFDAKNRELAAIQQWYINQNRSEISNTSFSLPYPGLDLSYLNEILEADIINLHWVAYFQSPATIKRLVELGTPVVWTLHDMWAFTGGCHYAADCLGYETTCHHCPQLRDDPLDLPAAVLQDKLDFWADLDLTIVTPSRWMADCAKRSRLFHRCRVEVIPNSVETELFVPMDKAKAKASLGLEPDTFAILIGADNGNEIRKGFSQLLKALQRCLQDLEFRALARNGKVQLLCFGLPNTSLASLDIPTVALGQVKSDVRLSQIYAAADVFVLPSLQDNLPNTMLEAMSCGTPVVGFAVGGIPDLVEDGVTGRLVPVGDSAKLATVLLDCMRSPELLQRMGRTCRHVIETSHTLNAQAQRYLTLYQDLLSKPSRLKKQVSQLNVPSLVTAKQALPVPLELGATTDVQIVLERAALRALLREHQKAELTTAPPAQVSELPSQTFAQMEEQIDKKKNQVRNLRRKLQDMDARMQELQGEIEAMKTSKFWKMRLLWLKLRAFVGLQVK